MLEASAQCGTRHAMERLIFAPGSLRASPPRTSAARWRSSQRGEVGMALRKVEALFLAIPIAAIAAIMFSAMNEAVDSGATFQGKVLGCSRLGRGLGLRLCTVDIGNSKEIHARAQHAKP